MNPINGKLKAIFDGALELSGPEREVYLARACGEDAELRQQVEKLLRALERAGSFLTGEDKGRIGPSAREDASPPGQLSRHSGIAAQTTDRFVEKPGSVIGRYKLRETIGEGGCGVVYVADQEEPVRRRVALKVIKLGMDTKNVVARFEAERQALAMMDHPNIAKVLDAGATETGRPYFVMELVRGVKITEYCDQNELSTRERLDLFVKVCQAVQHAHQKGIIHRDLKPSNILITLHDGVPVPKVIDFGIAKATEGRLTDLTVYTELRQPMGTPAYMSPEQAEMSGLDIDTRTDIYSLGVLLYELLTGKTPFDTQELMRAGLDELRRTIREKEPVRPSTRLSQELSAVAASRSRLGIGTDCPGQDGDALPRRRYEQLQALARLVRGDLDWIVMKCLEKDRARRYETANGLARDVQRHLDNEPIAARPPSAAYRLEKLVRRNRVVFATAAVIAGVLVLATAVSTWYAVHELRAEHEQTRLRRQAQDLERAARQRAYASDMNLAQQALARNNFGLAGKILDRQRPLAGQPDLRGWEWRYLWQQCRSDALFTLCQKSSPVISLANSLDGRWLAVGEYEEGGLSIWNLESGQETALSAGEGDVRVAFDGPQGLLAFSFATSVKSVRPRYGVRLWEPKTKEIVAELPLGGPCLGLAFSGDGGRLVTSTRSPDQRLTLWQVPQGTPVASYSAPQVFSPSGTPFALAHDGRMAAHGMPNGGLRVVDLTTGMELWNARAAEENVKALAFSPDGKVLASGAGFVESAIRLWDVASGREINRLAGHRSWVGALIFWPDGKTLASAGADQTICLWDVSDPARVPPPRILRGHKQEVRVLALLPDNTTLVSGCKDGSVYFWDTSAKPHAPPRVTLPKPVAAWQWAADGSSVLTLDLEGHVARWQGAGFQKSEPLMDIGTNFFPKRGLPISRGGRRLATGSTNGFIQVWDLQRGSLLRQFKASQTAVRPHTFLGQREKLVVVRDDDQSFHEWDLSSWEEVRSWRGAANWTGLGSAFSPDERWCLTLGEQNEGSLISMATGQARNVNLNIKRVRGVAFSPDGTLIAATSEQGGAKLWKAGTLEEVANLEGLLLSPAFSPDSLRLAISGNGDEGMTLWDVASHEELLILPAQGSMIHDTRFSADGTVLGCVNGVGILQLWRAPSWAEIERAERQRARKTSTSE